jgi:hypothetical protein
VNFKQALRIVIGCNIASARTETTRTEYLRKYLNWAFKSADHFAKEYPNAHLGLVGSAQNVNTSDLPPVTPERIAAWIERHKKDGFNELELSNFDEGFTQWSKGLLVQRARKAAAVSKAIRAERKKKEI